MDILIRHQANVRLVSFQFDETGQILESLRVKERVLLDFQIYRTRFFFTRSLSPEISALLSQLPMDTELRIVYDEDGRLRRLKVLGSIDHLHDYWLDDDENDVIGTDIQPLYKIANAVSSDDLLRDFMIR